MSIYKKSLFAFLFISLILFCIPVLFRTLPDFFVHAQGGSGGIGGGGGSWGNPGEAGYGGSAVGALQGACAGGGLCGGPKNEGSNGQDPTVDTRGNIVGNFNIVPGGQPINPASLCVAAYFSSNGNNFYKTACGQGFDAFGPQSMDPDSYYIGITDVPGYAVTWSWYNPNDTRCNAPGTYNCGAASGSGDVATVNVFFRTSTIMTITYTPTAIVKGNVDSVDCTTRVVNGWECDTGNPTLSTYEDTYYGADYPGNTSYYRTLANQPSNASVISACGGGTNHNFSTGIPAAYLDGNYHAVYGYGMNYSVSQYSKLSNSVGSFACPPPSGSITGTLSASPPTCSIGPGQSTCSSTVTWHVSQSSDVYVYGFNDDGSFTNVAYVNGVTGTDGTFTDSTIAPTGRYYYLYVYLPNLGYYYNNGSWIASTHVATTYTQIGYANATCSMSGLNISGWACDPNYPNTSDLTAFQYDGVQAIGYPTANQPYSAPGPVYCRDNYGNHGLNFTLSMPNVPPGMKGGTHQIYGYAYSSVLNGQYGTIYPGSAGSLTVTCPNYVSSWYQTKGEDVRVDPWTANPVPSGSVCGSQPYASVVNTNATPGVTFGGGSVQSFGTQGGSASAPNWQVGNNQYADTYTPIRRTSVSYMQESAKQQSVTPVELANSNVSSTCARSGGSSGDYLNCTLTGLTGGTQAKPAVYIATGNLTLSSTSVTFSSGSYIILTTGTLTINGAIHVTPGSANVTFSAGNIIIGPALGVFPTSCTPTPNLEGLYSSDGNITLPSQSNCVNGVVDIQLSIAGSLVANAGKTGGKLINNRDMCLNNANYPSLVVTERPDFALTTPLLLENFPSIFKEVAP